MGLKMCLADEDGYFISGSSRYVEWRSDGSYDPNGTDQIRTGIGTGHEFSCPPLYVIQLTQHLATIDLLAAALMQIFMNFCCNIPFGILLALVVHNSYVALQRKPDSEPGGHVPYATRLPGE